MIAGIMAPLLINSECSKQGRIDGDYYEKAYIYFGIDIFSILVTFDGNRL